MWKSEWIIIYLYVALWWTSDLSRVDLTSCQLLLTTGTSSPQDQWIVMTSIYFHLISVIISFNYWFVRYVSCLKKCTTKCCILQQNICRFIQDLKGESCAENTFYYKSHQSIKLILCFFLQESSSKGISWNKNSLSVKAFLYLRHFSFISVISPAVLKDINAISSAVSYFLYTFLLIWVAPHCSKQKGAGMDHGTDHILGLSYASFLTGLKTRKGTCKLSYRNSKFSLRHSLNVWTAPSF